MTKREKKVKQQIREIFKVLMALEKKKIDVMDAISLVELILNNKILIN